jgi:glycogen synthase
MMAGAVPVCFNIDGITDFMIEEACTGHLVEQEDAEAMAAVVARLGMDRARLAAMHNAVATEARARFSDTIAAEAYATLFSELMTEAPPHWTPRSWANFEPDTNFPQTWRRYVPPAIKRLARRVL